MNGAAKPDDRASRTKPTNTRQRGLADLHPFPQERVWRAIDLLASQPVSLAGLSKTQRDRLVITAVIDDEGAEHVVSRFVDARWNLQSIWVTQNDQPSARWIAWATDVPQTLLDDAKAAIYAWYKRGIDNTKLPSGKSLKSIAASGMRTLRLLAAQGIQRFDQVKPIHLADLVQRWKPSLQPSSILNQLKIVDLVWHFSEDVLYPMSSHPWGGVAFGYYCGIDDGKRGEGPRRGKTSVIPPSIQAAVFNYAERCLASAEKLLQERDSERRLPESHELKRVRDAVLYLLQITSGMRNNEAISVKRGAWRREIVDGVEYCWVTARETKTGKGLVDYLIPPETIHALELLARYAEPLQRRLADEIIWLEQRVARLESPAFPETVDGGQEERIALLLRLATAKASVDNVFLGRTVYDKDGSGFNSRIETLSNRACLDALARLAKGAGVSWKLDNHQCRRTFAWTVANSRLGRSSLIFIKWQLKHSSINMSQLYAANPNQDSGLYDQFYEELVAAQAEVLEDWFEEGVALAGGGGRRIMKARAIAIKDRKSLLRHTAEIVNIRSTGHSWCLAEQRGCVGEGIYEAIRCGSCSAGVIDQSHAITWQQIHLNNLQLAQIRDCGPAVEIRAKREVAMSATVLKELGIPLPTIDSTT